MDVNVQEQLEAARRRAIPIPWAPPMPNVDWFPYRRAHRRLVAEAVAGRLAGLTPALDSVGLDGTAREIERLARFLHAVEVAPDAPSVRAA